MVKCIGKNVAGNLRFCGCIMRQIRGCDDDEMRTGKNVRKNFTTIIQKIDWSKVTTCQGLNDFNEDRICLCFGRSTQVSCEEQMKIAPMNREEVLAHARYF